MKTFSQFFTESTKIPAYVREIQARIKIDPHTGKKTIDGDVNLKDKNLTKLPLDLSDVHVNGIFYCGNNQLTTLEGAPSTVGVDFFCHSNQLATLEGAPSAVSGNFYCAYNPLTTLEGAPSTVGKSFDCCHNQLTSLKGAPSTVGRDFFCDDNQLTSLDGAPNIVGNYFICDGNPNLPKNIPTVMNSDQYKQYMHKLMHKRAMQKRYGDETGDIVNNL